MFDIDNPVLAALAWSRLTEPGDAVAGALINALGPSEALRWLLQVQTDALSPPEPNPGALGSTSLGKLLTAAQGWLPRLDGINPEQDLRNGERVGAQLVLPTDPRWPARFTDLGMAAPLVLWVRGADDFAARCQRSVALVGSRASTHYGEQVTIEIAAGLAQRGFGVVSGGAYGIDAAAHRGTIVNGGYTVAFMAGGLDRPYPPGNTALLRAVMESGALVSEVPPGSTPYRNRFLARNRLIAALAGGTVVVEAAWRSGALSTARHASALLRPVGAVPGPVTSMASGGCHQLIRSGEAVLVADAGEVAELAGSIEHDAAEVPLGEVDETEGLTLEQKRVYGVLPLQRPADAAAITRKAGLPLPVVLAALGILEIRNLAQNKNNAWRRAPANLPPSA